MIKPRFSILMTSYNYSNYIGAAIESVIGQTFPDWELLVVDDCSTDDSWCIIQDFKDPRIRTHRHSVNLGACAAYSQARSMAQGEYIACLDSDDLFMSNKLERQAEFFDRFPEIDICGTFITEIDSNGASNVEATSQADWFNISVDLNDPSTWLWQNRLCHSSAVVRRKLHDRLGDFDNGLVYTPDWQFWLRALVEGARFAVIQEPLVSYRNHGGNITHKNRECTLLEHANTCAHILFPWLKQQGRQDLVEAGIQGFISHPDLGSESELISRISAILFSGVAMEEISIAMMRLLVKKESQLSAVYESKVWLESQLKETRAAISERDAAIFELGSVYQSRSWLVTKPLRKLSLVGISVSQIMRMSLIRFSSLLARKRLRNGLRLLLNGDFSGLNSAFHSVLRERRKLRVREVLAEPMTPCPLTAGQPLISVIIPCFNYGKFVLGAIDSVLAQTLENVEIIVVDGGSTDGETVEILRAVQRPRTRILFRDGRHLVGDNRNYGIELARGRYICCLDADDTLDITYLEKAVFYLETYGYDIVSTAIKFVGAKTGYLDNMQRPDLTDMVNGNHILTCAVFRRLLWEDVGGYFDVGIGMHHVAEDWDFWLRLVAKGARVRNISGEYLFHYRVHEGGSLSSSADVKSLQGQKEAILDRNRNLLTREAYEYSKGQNSRFFRCEPTQTALASCMDIDPHRMTLLLAMPYCLVGGAERLLSGLCEYFANQGWRLIVVSTLPQEPGHGTSIDWFKASSSEVYSLPAFLESAERVDFIAYLLTSRRVDCLLNTGSRMLYEMLPSLNKSNPNLKIIDFLFNTVGHIESHLEFKEFISFAMAENQEVYDWYVKFAGWPVGRLLKVSSGVNLKRFSPGSRPAALVDQYRIDATEMVVGFSGRFSEEKAPEVFVEVARLCRGRPNIRFVMTGAGPLSETIEKEVGQLPPGVRFEFAGLVDDVGEYLALYDVLILPSRFDGRPLVVMEALASGVPVIASNVGGLPDLVFDGKNGFLVPSADAKMISDHILRLAENRPLLAMLKEGARRIAEEKLDANLAYRDFEASLCNAIGIRLQ